MNLHRKLTKQEVRMVMRSMMEERAKVTPNRQLPGWVRNYWTKVTS